MFNSHRCINATMHFRCIIWHSIFHKLNSHISAWRYPSSIYISQFVFITAQSKFVYRHTFYFILFISPYVHLFHAHMLLLFLDMNIQLTSLHNTFNKVILHSFQFDALIHLITSFRIHFHYNAFKHFIFIMHNFLLRCNIFVCLFGGNSNLLSVPIFSWHSYLIWMDNKWGFMKH